MKKRKKEEKEMKKITILFQPVSLEHSYNYLGQEGKYKSNGYFVHQVGPNLQREQVFSVYIHT